VVPELPLINALMSMSEVAADRQAIRELIESWAVWRDTGDWDRLRSLWHADGRMVATWFDGTADQFVAVCRQAWSKGVRSWHTLGGMIMDVSDNRAVAQTRTAIAQRSPVDGVLCDVVCTGRFYDFLEKRDGRWGLVLRQPIYEKDRIDPVDPSAHIKLEETLLSQFPSGYRHLAYLQTKAGYLVNRHLPGLDGSELEALYDQGARWLNGEALRR
jgi:SnoaL-like domain